MLLAVPEAMGQRPRRRGGNVFSSQVAEKRVRELDSTEIARRDSLHRADSLFRVDSTALMQNTSLSAPAFSAARDSMVEVFSDGHRLVYFYGDVSVKYQDMTLTAERMDYDMSTGTVHAYGVYDSLSGEWKGRPVMTQGKKTYDMEELRYNFNTKQARITNMLTSEEEGLLHGDKIKMMEDNSINI
ncbi:MAG: hypothetical protein K6C31_06830, partial [Bacteroidales bacterium]|nr:hypothetical protein [Bacteroidales bacterium]